MDKLNRLGVRTRLLQLTVVVVAGLLVLAAVSLMDSRSQMLGEKQAKTRAVVELAWGVLEHHQQLEKTGKLGRDEAQAQALAVLRGLRYDEREYFWINDRGRPVPKMIMHATVPGLDGKLLDDPRFNRATSLQAGAESPPEQLDKANLFVAFVDVVAKGGHGYVRYDWPKPLAAGGTTTELYAKLSYVKGFEPWGWVVGSGIYIDDIDAQFQREALRLGIVAGILVIVLLVASTTVGSSILRQLGGEPAYAAEVTRRVADGDLGQTVRSDSGKDSLLGALRDMQERLAGIFREINSAADELSKNAGDVATAAQQSSTAGERQSQSTSAAAAALQEVTVSVNEVSEIARGTDASSQKVATLAATGKRELADAGAEIGRVASTVQAASTQVQTLLRRSEEIGGIANVIKEIADQTNLLALNAAIEAARAGEQGRGFAVVADEVRKLAERTAKATTEIASVIGTVQGETQAAVRDMEQVLPLVKRGAELTAAAIATLEDIHRESLDSLNQVHELAHATREQATASNEIASNVEQIATMAEEVHAAMSNTSEHACRLEGIARELRERIAYFRV